jgi:hypothetical protein
MYRNLRRFAFAVAIAAVATGARAESLSTSANNPTVVPPNGVITGNFPAGTEEATYYLAIDLKAGTLATQISLLGRPNRDKSFELDVKDPKGRMVGYTSVMNGLDANQEATRVFPADSSGKYLLILKTKGPETTSFRVELGGSALPNRRFDVPEAAQFSRSYLAPTPMPKDGSISGAFPGGDKVITYYYFAVDLKAGDLMTQISFNGRRNADKKLELALLDNNGRTSFNTSYYIMDGLDATSERTKALPIDSSGRYVVRIAMSGVEGTNFKVEVGGSAFQAGM